MKIPKILIFNAITKFYFRQFDNMPFPGRRLKSMGVDFAFTLSIFFPIILIVMALTIFLPINSFYSTSLIHKNLIIGIIPFSLMVFLLINKDFFNGRSIAKRIYGYQIVDIKTNTVANEMQCMIRNATMIIYPLEAIFALASPGRRIGDFIAGTKIVDKEKEDPEFILDEMKQIEKDKKYSKLIIVSILITFLFEFLSFLPAFFLK